MLSKKIYTISILVFAFAYNLLAQDVAAGAKLIRSEKYIEAQRYFTSLLNTKQKAEACFYLGEIYFKKENVDSARIFYTKGIEANSEFPLNYAGMVRLNVLDGKENEANKNELKAIDLADEKNSQVYVILSEAYSRIKNYDKALDILNQAIENKIKSADIYIAMGQVYLGKINGTEAVRDFDTALNIEPGNPEALTLKANVYSLINNFNGAIELLNEAITSDSSYSPAYGAMAEVYADIKDYNTASVYYNKYIDKSEITLEKLKRYASILYLNKEYDKAINESKDVITIEPKNTIAYRIIAYSYLKLEKNDDSKSYFQKLFDLNAPDYLPTDYENYADLLSKTGNDSLAIEYLHKVVELDSTRKDIYSKLSILYFKHKDWNGVISSLEAKKDLTAQEDFDLGKAYYFTQNYQKSDSAFNILVSKLPDLAIAYFWQARVKTNFDPESDSGLAKPYYEQFIALSKEDTTKLKKELIEAYSYLGYYFFLKQDNANSKFYWQKVYALDPNNTQAIQALKGLK